MSLRTAFVIVVLLAAAFATWYLSKRDADTTAGDIGERVAHQGFYLLDARILGTGTDGTLLYEILAESAEQLEDQSLEFDTVQVRYSPTSGVPWTVDADRARVYRGDRRVHLSGHVRAVSETGIDGNATELRTPALELDPDRFVARTDERVQIRVGERSLTATGMVASLDDNRLDLHSNVSGKFAP